MHSKIRFIKQAIKNYSQIWAVFPSSWFLAKKMVKNHQIQNSKTIVELWAWTWIFTKNIFDLLENLNEQDKKSIFIIEKDIELYKTISKKFPQQKQNIYNDDMLNLKEIIAKKWLNHIDLIISWIPFRSLPKEIFTDMMEKVLPEIISKETVFIQFSYIKSTKKMFEKYFENVEIDTCLLNIPSAFIFTCSWFLK